MKHASKFGLFALIGFGLSLPCAGASWAQALPPIVPTGINVVSGTDEKKDAEVKIPDSVKGVEKRLSESTENVTVEDLNAAREAAAKLDLLIEIQKKKNDLNAQINKGKEEKNAAALAIPAAALGMPAMRPPVLSPLPQESVQEKKKNLSDSDAPIARPVVMMPPPPPPARIEIDRIVGANGHYIATVKVDDKTTKVQAGDKLSDGSEVKDVTSQGITIINNGKTKTVHIKDVGTVAHGM